MKVIDRDTGKPVDVFVIKLECYFVNDTPIYEINGYRHEDPIPVPIKNFRNVRDNKELYSIYQRVKELNEQCREEWKTKDNIASMEQSECRELDDALELE
ncbi:hypothetical protein [Anaeromicropila herbilytica]|uniref:Uncharacterized protein n=1 Tax=Anaeromicropila herbilytica TaxID=2785025 RepID=A0A7R7EIR6_9FIRM|nr:hypothetical protein [Anaeromicropila herbilytica]BCN29518.1 hypothetical protein bsdtb5_08130 [Anaeromicropila herbilytica]